MLVLQGNKKFQNTPSALVHACQALGRLANHDGDDNFRGEIFLSGGIEQVIRVLKRNEKDAELQAVALQTIGFFAFKNPLVCLYSSC
jgi:hypothetical protein